VLLAPPFIATRDQLQEIARRLAASIDAVTSKPPKITGRP
jgi:adenosylmethionine-8-amino-7-oxononanoate aminotransferase